ncbi:hypothetical protein DGI_3522 [Megalodesulfovibrio gigas DSM 1382 = ATCC 19364]|uniref:Vitamin K epoxide reductase n=2 Tax=Megalodesulfovibrio gigas TaxID=879 RepID=T2GFV8_MEGG1|nr:hypothetical protein DGI_3522 [Megalodesulfovibrio gigas DSM 1382 = ATCC 19364]
MRILATILLALAGALLCAVSALDYTTPFCTTAGCALFKGTSIAGLSLYWIGAAGFFLLAVLYSVGRRLPLLRRTADWCLAAALAFDAVLLGVLAVTVPCLICLVVAAVLGATALAAWPTGSRWRRVLIVWAMLFAASVAGLGRGAVSPVPITEVPSPALQLYVSPTCPECRTAVLRLLARTELLGQTAFYPIAKTAEDERRLLAMHASLQEGRPLAEILRALVADAAAPDVPASSADRLRIWVMSMCNKIAVLHAGSQTVPFLQASAAGMLQLLSPPVPAATGAVPGAPTLPMPAGQGFSLPGLMQTPAPPQGCGFAEQTPCD